MTSAVASAIVAAPTCPGCGAVARLLYAGRDGHEHATPGEIYRIARMSYSTPLAVWTCPQCTLAWARSPYDPAKILAAYGEGEDPAYGAEERGRRATFRRGLEWVQGVIPRGRLLDVGAASGFLLAEARDLGYEVTGLEPSTWAAAEAKRRYGFELIVGNLESASFAPASFDVVTMVDVIEHFVDPAAALHAAAGLLRPGGVLYLVTPNIGGVPARLLGRRWWGLEPWHLWFFTVRSLSAMLAKAGFSVTSRRSYRRTFSVDYWLRKGEGMSDLVARMSRRLASWTGLGRKDLSLDLRDTIELIAVRAEF